MPPRPIPDFYSAACFDIPEGTIPEGISNRAPFLPRPYIVQNHVLVRQPHTRGKVYVYKEDVHNEGRMRRIRKHVKTLNIPKGSPERLRRELGTFGLFVLIEYLCVISIDILTGLVSYL